MPLNYFDGFSENESRKAMGNGWTVDVIAHIFKGMHAEK
jgi:DNA (cytosine-5)-methyltransferase 3A